MKRRLVVLGRKVPGHSTLDVTYANTEPLWAPLYRSVPSGYVDPDEVHKRLVEAQAAGEDRFLS